MKCKPLENAVLKRPPRPRIYYIPTPFRVDKQKQRFIQVLVLPKIIPYKKGE